MDELPPMIKDKTNASPSTKKRQSAVTVGCFCLSGSRELVGLDRAKELLAELSSVTSHLTFTSINLSNKSYSDDAAVVIGEEIKQQCASVTVANISDMIAGRQEEEALRALKSISDGLRDAKLEVLECDDNAMGKPGVIACEAVLRQKSLRHLSLMNDGLSGAAAEQLAAILLGTPEAPENCPPLQIFHYHNNMSGDEGAIAVARIVKCCPELRDFRFSTTRSKQKGCLHVANALQSLETSSFENLDLSDNSFGGACIKPLADFLRRQTSLSALTLRDSGLDESGLEELTEALVEARPPLRKLDLSGNDLEENSGESLVSIIEAVAETVEDLELDDNCFGSDVASQVATALKKCKQLRRLNVNNCDISALGAYRLAKAVSRLPVFDTLAMDGNLIHGDYVGHIEDTMTQSGKFLAYMEDNDEDGEDDMDGEHLRKSSFAVEKEEEEGGTGLEAAMAGAKI